MIVHIEKVGVVRWPPSNIVCNIIPFVLETMETPDTNNLVQLNINDYIDNLDSKSNTPLDYSEETEPEWYYNIIK